jgi:hypothetical protein
MSAPVSAQAFSATLCRGEAVLRFPYDDDLRRLLRALPGRRWDPLERAWCVPVEPEQARALELLLRALPGGPLVSAELARALARARARRRGFLVDLSRPDEEWWLTFALDGPPAAVAALLEHPQARSLPAIGRALVPLDDAGERTLSLLAHDFRELTLSERTCGALAARHEPGADERPGAARETPGTAFDVALRRDRRGDRWIVFGHGAATAAARALCGRLGLRGSDGPAGSFGVSARERDAEAIRELVGQLDGAGVDPRVPAWIEHACAWRGTVDAGGPPGAPVLLLLGDPRRLPPGLRARVCEVTGGAAVPLDASAREQALALGAWLTAGARRCLAAVGEGRPAPGAVLELSRVHADATFVLAPGHDPSRVAEFAALPGALAPIGRGGDEHAALHALRADPFCVPDLDRLLDAGGVWVEPSALEQLQRMRERHARSAGIVELSAAGDAPLAVAGLGGELKPFQRAGVAYALARRRAFLADEQGLGKTIQALAALEADGAYPAVVVCPASLKLNWLRELERWLPRRTVNLLGGGERGAAARGPDVTIVNYDVLARRLAELSEPAPRALVLDESHYCKNAAAKRTQAAQRLAAAVAPDGLVLALTGTPVTNRPAELVSQLRILGRLDEFGSGARFGRRFHGPDAHLRLHWHLRARCLVRRLKAEVLPQLPAKTRAIVPVELDNEPEYRLAERDVVAWLQSQPLDLRELDARVAAALRAERLVRLNALKQLAARGKLRAALTWIHDFRSSGERLVVFARHREVQRALLAHFPDALHILGEDGARARERALAAFQAPDEPGNQLIVCSLEVAGHGLTLTRASNVAFLELDWTPAKHDQAEDRCHRIGQRDAVTAYYLLAANTVDESIARLLQRKRAVIAAVTDGREEDEEGVLDALVRELRGAPYRHLRAVA